MPILASNHSYCDDPYLRESHNCYSYFLNLKDPEATELCKKTYTGNNLCRRSQPGYASGYKSLQEEDFNCPEIVERTLADNPDIYKVDKAETCKPDFYKGAVVVAPGHDYHYYRLNDDMIYYNGKRYETVWTHKPGYKPNTYLDADNKVITDPETANRNYGSLNYKDFCGHVCVPRDPSRKQMRMYNQIDNRGPLLRIKEKLTNTVKNIVRERNQVGGKRSTGKRSTGKRSKRSTGKRRNKKLNVNNSNSI